MKNLLTIFFLGAFLTVNAQTYMYIGEGVITPESPVSTTDEVFIQLTGDFSDSGADVDDYNVSLDGTTVNLEINASSEGGLAVLTPFDLTYELGTYEPGEYTVEITGSGIGVYIEGPLTFVVEEGGTGSISKAAQSVNFELYPNPVNDLMTLNFEKWQSGMEMQLISSDGKIILVEPLIAETTQVNVSDIEAGIYLIRIRDQDGVTIKTERVAITH